MRGLHFLHGAGARIAKRVRASARASAAAHRLGRPGRGRGARRGAREALDQARVEALRARPRRADDGPDHARGGGHARQGRCARSKAMRPDPADLTVPPVAAVCVYPNLVPPALERAPRQRRQGRVRRDRLPVRPVADRRSRSRRPRAVAELGADEIDMVIDRGAFLSGRYAKVYDEIVRVKEACGDAHLKVILETGELGTYDNVRRASPARHRGRRRLHQDVDGEDRPPRRCRSRWSCSRRSATSTRRPGRRSA